jgi:hypothetical protein
LHAKPAIGASAFINLVQRNRAMRTNPLSHLLRAAALSAALVASGAATALADVPGYDFPNEWQPRHAPMQVQAAPPALAAMPSNCTTADAATPALAARVGRMASNHPAPDAASARSGG